MNWTQDKPVEKGWKEDNENFTWDQEEVLL